ncbi:MAG TPA: MBL fold metallo-hydrolase [Dehalococcoidales bacterium]|nr:MBL fold metallo-hydrolase [Dehalococcoidales bacterium]
MDINWLGLSCFRIRGSQAIIITDPFPPESGYALGKQTADIVTVSHQHANHNYVQGVSGPPRIVKGPGEYEISGVLVLGVPTYHDAVKGQSRGKNTAYMFEIDGVTICHLGDIGHVIEDRTLEDLGKVDILMLPVGGVTTITASMAAETIRKIEPKVVLPMHYKTPGSKLELEPLEAFLKEMGQATVEPKPKLNINKNNLPLTMQVTVLSI